MSSPNQQGICKSSSLHILSPFLSFLFFPFFHNGLRSPFQIQIPMPRLPTSLLRHARAINPLYPLLLQTCRTIPSAHNELRWLRQHVETTLSSKFGSLKDVPDRLKHRCVAKLARRRGRGEPLQYLLGSQPFGELDIKCERGVLIPRYVFVATGFMEGCSCLGGGGKVRAKPECANLSAQHHFHAAYLIRVGVQFSLWDLTFPFLS